LKVVLRPSCLFGMCHDRTIADSGKRGLSD
jgi:hypothetical protein